MGAVEQVMGRVVERVGEVRSLFTRKILSTAQPERETQMRNSGSGGVLTAHAIVEAVNRSPPPCSGLVSL